MLVIASSITSITMVFNYHVDTLDQYSVICYSFQGNAAAVTTLVTLGRIFANWAGSVCGVYVQELFPTSFR